MSRTPTRQVALVVVFEQRADKVSFGTSRRSTRYSRVTPWPTPIARLGWHARRQRVVDDHTIALQVAAPNNPRVCRRLLVDQRSHDLHQDIASQRRKFCSLEQSRAESVPADRIKLSDLICGEHSLR